MNGEDLTQVGAEVSDIEKSIDLLSEKGYDSNRIMEVMSSVGYDSNQVYNEFVRRHEDERQRMLEEKERADALFQQQRDAYDALLKKKDLPSEQDGESLDLDPQLPGAQASVADPRLFEIRQNDELAMNGVTNSRIGNELVRAVSFNDSQAVTKALESAQSNGLLTEFSIEDEYDQETLQKIQGAGNEMIGFGKSSYQLALSKANEINKSLGIDIEYDINSETDFGLFLRESVERVERNEEDFNKRTEQFIQQIPGMRDEEVGFGSILLDDLSFSNMVSGMAAFQADVFGEGAGLKSLYGDSVTSEYYQEKIRKTNQANAQREKLFYEDLEVAEEAYSMGSTERVAAAWRGDISMGDYLAATTVETSRVMVDGIKSIAEYIINPAVLAIDVFGESYGNTRTYSPHLSITEAAVTSAAKATTEVVMERIMMGLGVGAEALVKGSLKTAKQTLRGSKRAAIDKARKDLAGKLTGSLSGKIIGNTAIEGLEEGLVEITNWAIDAADNVAMGRNVKDLNFSEVGDAFFAGMAGGFGPIAVTQLPSHRGHIKFMSDRSNVMKAIAELRKDYEAETDPVRKKELEKDLMNAMVRSNVITNAENKMYEDFSPEEKRTVIMYNQEISNLQQTLDTGKYWNGDKVTSEERTALEARLKNAIDRKAKIEAGVEARQGEEQSKEEVETPPTVENAAETKAETKTRKVPKSEKDIHKDIPVPTEKAPQGQEQEAVQLSLFDENTVLDPVAEPETQPEVQEEAPVQEEVKTEAEQEADKPVEEQGFFELNAEEAQKFDLKDTKVVGDGAGQISIPLASKINKVIDAFGKRGLKGIKVRYHRNTESLRNVDPEVAQQLDQIELQNQQSGKKARLGGYFLNGTIHLHKDSDALDVLEEFSHGVLKDVIGKEAKSRERLYNELVDMSKGKSKAAQEVKKVLDERERLYKGVSDATMQEESIVFFLVNYAQNPSSFSSLKSRIKSALNRFFKSVGAKSNIIKTDDSLLRLANKFRDAAQGVETQVQPETRAETEPETEVAQETVTPDKDPADMTPEELEAYTNQLVEGAEGVETSQDDALSKSTQDIDVTPGMASIRQKQNFNYLKDTEIFYTHYPTLGAGDLPLTSSRYTTYSVEKSVKVNDYFHFRNWYNYQTGNQVSRRIANMYFIKDGKKYNVNPPRPKVDRNGKIVPMDLPLTFRQRQRQESFQKAKDSKNILARVKDINDTNRKLFDTIPWNGLVNAREFAPATKPLYEMTANDKYVAAVIEQKNLQAAIDMGLTKEEVQERVNKPDRGGVTGKLNRLMDGDIVNATGLVPFEQAETGDTVGMFALRDLNVEKLGKPDHVASNEELADLKEGNIERIKNLFMKFFGYDRSMPNQEKGITSGIRAVQRLDETDIPELKEGERVLSTHVSFSHAQKGIEAYRKEAQARYRQDNSVTSGEFGAGFTVLLPEATRGNPDVVKAYLNGLLARSKDREAGLPGPALYNKFTSTGKRLIRSMVKQAEAEQYEGLSPETARLFSSPEFDRPVTTEKQFQEIIDVAINFNEKLPDQFEARKSLFSEDLLEEFLGHESYEMAREIPHPSLKMDDQIAEYFNDPSLSNQAAGTLIGYKTFSYEVEVVEGAKARSKGGEEFVDFKEGTIRAVKLDGYGFAGAIVVKGEVSDLEVLKEQYTLDRLDPDQFKDPELVPTTEPDPETGIRVAKDTKTPYQRMEERNRYSRIEMNSVRNDYDGNASIREGRGLTSIRTDQGTFELSDLNSYQEWRNKWIKRLQDKYVDIFKIQQDVETARGKIDRTQDFRMAEELMYGKAAEDLRKLDEKVDGITSELKANKISPSEISEYLYALHAPERNQLISERSEGKITEGSGMSNARAKEIINAIPSGKQKAYDNIVKMVREIQQDTRDTMVNFGLESKETIDAFEAMYENYTPLSGIATDEETSFDSSYPTGGAGLSVFGPTTKRAEGRKTEATDILAQVIAQNASIHIKSRTNEALQSLYNLVEQNPNPKVWRIVDAEKARQQDPHSVGVRVGGEQKFIRFKDASHAETLRNLNLPATTTLIRVLRAPSNWLRRSFTTLNPEFMVSNFSRDIQAALFNAAAEADIPGGLVEGNAIIADMIKTVPATLKALTRDEVGALKKVFKDNPEIERYYNDFREDGGKTGWSYAKPLSDIAKDLEGKTGEKTRMQEILGKGKNFLDTIEGVNDAFENSIRLSAYIAAREKGVGREKAAQLAKNITVNFNKSGEYGQAINAAYLFFNASVQGTARLGKSLLTFKEPTYPDGSRRRPIDRINNAQKMAAALTVFNGLLTMLGLAMSGEDEDGELYYNKIPAYIKERNLIIMRPDGENYYKIPMPYGFSVFANLGNLSVEVGAGHKEIDEAMFQMISSTINSFSPVSFGQSEDLITKVGKTITPTFFTPIIDYMANETYFGTPVRAKNLPYGLQKPESSLSFRSPESVQQFFRWLNEASGGSTEVKGDIDINPDAYWYFFEYFIGGAGKFVTRTGEATRRLAAKASDTDVQIEANDIPFLRLLYGEPSKFMDVEDYRKRRDIIKSLRSEMKAGRRDDPGRYDGVLLLNQRLDFFDKQLKNIRAQKRKALNIKDYAQRTIRIEELREKERSIVMNFNEQYEKLRGKKD
tara:strand:- start:7154 stop:15004 length:7851 start_codon:yes stop_codon:yes gene_type:complete